MQQGCLFLDRIIEGGFYGLLFSKRRVINARGTPVRASIYWAMLEEVRICIESRYNQGEEVEPLFRRKVETLLGKYFQVYQLLLI